MVCDAVSRDFDVRPPVVAADIKSWDFGQYLNKHIGEDWWSWLEKHAYLWGHKAKPVPGAIGGIEQLRRAGHRVELLTSKPPWGERYVWTWLDRYAPTVSGVTFVPLGGYKPELTDALVLVDDRDKNVLEWVESREGRVSLLFTRAHNAGLQTSAAWKAEHFANRVFRVDNWRGVLAMIEKMEANL